MAFLSPTAHSKQVLHQVRSGETLSSIASQHGVAIKVIRKANRLSSNHLRVGQKLKIVAPSSKHRRRRAKYYIRKGDTPAKIAKKHHMKLKELYLLNPKIKKKPLGIGKPLWVKRNSSSLNRRKYKLYQLQNGPGYVVKNKAHAWGTFLAVTRLGEVLSEYSRRFPDAPPINIYDLSREGGGPLAPHRSHRRGRDVDIQYPLTVPKAGYVDAKISTLDLKRTMDLVATFIRRGDVKYIFIDYRFQRALYKWALEHHYDKEELAKMFQYPRGPHTARGIIRHEPGHKAHFHVRFKAEKIHERPSI